MSMNTFGAQCGTPGCDNTGTGISIAVSHPSVYRCNGCHDCINALAPHRIPGLTDRAAYEERNREIGQLDADTLRAQAAPILERITAARDAYARLADLVGAAVARDTVTAIVNAGDRVLDVTLLNWWAAYRWPEHHPAIAPSPTPYTFDHTWRISVRGVGIGTVRRTTSGVTERYLARDLTGGTIRPDLPLAEEPTYSTPHEAAHALAAWAARTGWDQS
ncbi:hypothetical protein [Amycolatopsis anabasis]|uniref:hypothetical protein n=1 Tax=Amycolatopsis anabasis TaxID=1840409 RepID=UPI00131BE311|nr:hypothetical protein [Amycolatopsis anabasis]